MIIKEIQTKNLIVKSGIPGVEFAVNPYTGCPHKCLYCYAEFMKRFTDHRENWGDFLDVKNCDFSKNPINAEKFKGRSILFGSVTDCYNPFEKKYEKTRNILKEFAGSQCKISVLTKSSLIVRDIDILKQIPNLEVGFSFSSLDRDFQKIMEPGASSPEEKFSAVKLLKDSGVKVWIFISPFFPELTDYKAIIEKCRTYTNHFGFESLKLRALYKTRVLTSIKENYPTVFPVYENIFCKNGGAEYWYAAKKEIAEYCEQQQLDFDIFFEADHKEKSV